MRGVSLALVVGYLATAVSAPAQNLLASSVRSRSTAIAGLVARRHVR